METIRFALFKLRLARSTQPAGAVDIRRAEQELERLMLTQEMTRELKREVQEALSL